MAKKTVKKTMISIILFIIKPFIVPIIIITILLLISCSITDIFYVAYNNDDKIDMKKELKYYDEEKEYEKNEMKDFLSSVWDFIQGIFGIGEMSEQTDWPVERTLYNN